MGALRSLMTGGSPRRRGLLVFGLLMMVIAGLLAMHALSMSGPHGHTSPALTIETDHAAEAMPDGTASAAMADEMAGASMSDAAAAGETDCGGGCGEPSPSHSMLMMGCVIALLIGLTFLIAPGLLSRGWLTRLLAVRALPLLGAVLPRPRPPSLIVLSISRT